MEGTHTLENMDMGHQYKENLASQSGFAVTGLVILLPLLVSGLLCFVFLIFSIKNYTLAQKTCVQHVLSTQNQLEMYIKSLLFLNPKATYLRVKELTLRAQYLVELAALNPNALVTKAKIDMVKMKRKKLDLKQKNILRKSRLYLRRQIAKFNRKMRKILNAGPITHKYYHSTSMSAGHPIAVKRREKQGPAPNYKRTDHFSSDQNITVSWNMRLHHGLPDWIKTSLNKQKSLFHCSGTIKKKNGAASPHLTHIDKKTGFLDFPF